MDYDPEEILKRAKALHTDLIATLSMLEMDPDPSIRNEARDQIDRSHTAIGSLKYHIQRYSA